MFIEHLSQMANLKIYIPTCDDNIFVMKYFQYFFEKYWDNETEVKVLGFNSPKFKLNNNFEFISLGNFQIGGAKGWTNYLIPFFNQIDDDYFIFGIDDFMIARPLNNQVFQAAMKLLNGNLKIGRIDLQPLQFARNSNLFDYLCKIDQIEFMKMKEKGVDGENIYRNSGAFSIWNKEWFLKNMKPNWSPWDWETEGSQLAENDGYDVIGSLNNFAIKKSELLSKQWPSHINTLGLRKEDIKEMKKLIEPEDRIKKFKVIGRNKFGYREYGGKNWIEQIYGP
jgi:hypothetical protein